jgi:hypothetical protein
MKSYSTQEKTKNELLWETIFLIEEKLISDGTGETVKQKS